MKRSTFLATLFAAPLAFLGFKKKEPETRVMTFTNSDGEPIDLMKYELTYEVLDRPDMNTIVIDFKLNPSVRNATC